MAISIKEQKDILGRLNNDWWKLDRIVPDDQKRKEFLHSVIADKTELSTQVINKIVNDPPSSLSSGEIVDYLNAIPEDQFYNHRGIQGWDHSVEYVLRNFKTAGQPLAAESLRQPLQDLAHLVNANGKNDVPKSAKLKYVASFLAATYFNDEFFQNQSSIVSDDEFAALAWECVHDERVTTLQWDQISKFADTAKSKDVIAYLAKDWSSDNRQHAKQLQPKIDRADIPIIETRINDDSGVWSARNGLVVAATLTVGDDLPESFNSHWVNELRAGGTENLDVSYEALSCLSVERRRTLLTETIEQTSSPSRAIALVGLAESNALAVQAIQRLKEANIDKWAKQNWEIFLTWFAKDCAALFRTFVKEKQNATKLELATRALANAKEAENAEVFVELLGAGSKAVRNAALQGLEDLGGDAVAAIEAGTKAKKKAVRESCESLLAALGSKSGTQSELEDAAAQLPASVLETIAAFPVHQTIDFDADVKPLFEEHGLAVILPIRDWVAIAPESWNRTDLWTKLLGAYADEPGVVDIAMEMVTRLPNIYNYYAERYMQAATKCKGAPQSVEAILKTGTTSNYREFLYTYLARTMPKKADMSIWLDGLSDTKKSVRVQCEDALTTIGDDAFEPVLKLLSARKKNARLGAANVLGALKSEKAIEALTAAVAKEKSDDVIVAMETAIGKCGGSVLGSDDEEVGTDDVLAALRKQRKTKPPKFIDLGKLPNVVLEDGTTFDSDDLHSLISRLKKETGEFSDPVLRLLADQMTAESKLELSRALYNAWGSGGSPSKEKWCVFQLAYFTSPEILDKFAPNIDELATSNHHLAKWQLQTLAHHQGTHGMSWVAHWARAATRSSVRGEANTLLNRAAQNAGQSIDHYSADLNAYISDDCADRSVPTLGLENGPIEIDYGARVFDVQLDQNGQVVCIERESGKKTKSLPKARKGEDDSQKGVVTQLKKDVRRVSNSVGKRFEEGMISGRTWDSKAFKELFGKHPVLTPMAGRIVFATDDGQTFRVSDGEFLDVDYEPVSVDDGKIISAVHRLTLGEDLAGKWGEHFTDSEIVQPFEQIGRPVYALKTHPLPDKAGPVKRASLAGRLRSQGWRNGYAEDAGMMYDASRLFPGRNLRVSISHGGFYIGDPSWDGDEEIDIESIELMDLRGKSLKAKDVDPIAYSEAFYAVEQLVRQ